ncbi:MBL fold metallo-hydrolase [Halorubellus sp. JP-L1]|uniref:MBL fold metallo-hydrolase n=1 Tax=Halorubellus sp. JP-L1 TaxID=2715753 RepID=UPI0014093A4D|nr:MBL fold metallo-hydrolase [Halorubellus sp. JP-L1]NHN40764.1 MBL fold metallo-hydrolase [Halorubellus sp. JP-L1]
MTVSHDSLELDWLGYATLRIASDDAVVYVDPGRYGVLTGEWTPDTPGVAHPPATDYRPEDGDVVCVTHDHHYDPDGIRRVAGEDATLVVFDGLNTHRIDRVDDRPVDLDVDVRWVDAEADFAVGEPIVRTVPAYNTPDGHTRPNGDPYHPEGRGCGFLLTLDDTTVFWPGDTDVLDGHAELDVDVFCPPIGGSFTMDRHEAADLAEAMAPDLVVPIHYNTFAALETDSAAFADELDDRGVAVELDED